MCVLETHRDRSVCQRFMTTCKINGFLQIKPNYRPLYGGVQAIAKLQENLCC